jgi:hypothetical protein
MEVTVHYLIFPDGPGSWVKGAKWDEWVVSIRNLGQSDVTVSRIGLIDQRGVYVGLEPASVYKLESSSEFMTRKKNEGLAVSALGFGSALVTGLIGIPIAAPLAIPLQFMPSQGEVEAKDRDAVAAELNRRRLPYSLELTRGGSVKGSVFFPLGTDPQALVVRYWSPRGEGERQVKIPLDKISTASARTAGEQKP